MTTVIEKQPLKSPETNRAASLSAQLEGQDALSLLKAAKAEFGTIALSSSFGADSVVLLHLVSQFDADTPVVFLDTDRHFFQTIQYRNQLTKRLGLTQLINLKADPQEVADFDPKSELWSKAPDACCALRKVRPLNRTLPFYSAWITGRKRFQSETRTHMPLIEWDGNSFKINPLATWSRDDIADYIKAHDLPEHPLVEQGYLSIGCYSCTKPVELGEDARSGRWAGQDKTECGIHRSGFEGEGI